MEGCSPDWPSDHTISNLDWSSLRFSQFVWVLLKKKLPISLEQKLIFSFQERTIIFKPVLMKQIESNQSFICEITSDKNKENIFFLIDL